MAKRFELPEGYKSPLIAAIKGFRRARDPKRQDFSPTAIDCGPVKIKVARHFGFCFGVENAVDIAYRAVRESGGRRIFLLSEMIHNPEVNADLLRRGVRFLMHTDGTRLINFDELQAEDIVIVPAFGTTVELQKELQERGVDPYLFDATCPFVEKVWKRADQLGENGFTVVIHGKRAHEETRATFSHSNKAPRVVVRNMVETQFIIDFILGKATAETVLDGLKGAYSPGFDPEKDLRRIGVVNQTTMLADETLGISKALRDALLLRYGQDNLSHHFADTKDTLCYATNENQSAAEGLILDGCDVALVVGGYNSSNTSHLATLIARAVPTFYISGADEILDGKSIRHFDLVTRELTTTTQWIPEDSRTGPQIVVGITAGASCPDRVVDDVIRRVLSFFPQAKRPDEILQQMDVIPR